MKVVILAGGFGTRLGQEISLKPKMRSLIYNKSYKSLNNQMKNLDWCRIIFPNDEVLFRCT